MGKNITSITILIGLAAVLYLPVLQGCSKSGAAPPTPPTPVAKNTQLLTSTTWKMQSVQVDGVDETSLFTGMTISFTSTEFTTVNGNIVWPRTDTWSFTDATATSFIRNDGVTVTIESLNATSLQVSLAWTKTTLGGGRISSVSGQYLFTFTN